MKYKKIILLTIFLTFLLAVSAVSANDLNATDEIGSEEVVMGGDLQVTQDNIVSTTHVVEGNTFDDIQIAIDNSVSGDIIELSGNYTGNGKVINVDKKLNIVGKGVAILDAQMNSSKIISILSDGVIISNLTFVNSNLHGIYSESYSINSLYSQSYEFQCNGCTFINNKRAVHSSLSHNNGIDYDNPINSCLNCTFINNTICAISGCNAIGCIFINNSNDDGLGAISGGGYVKNCIFSNNLGSSGVVKIQGDIINSTFIDNHVTNDGGAINFNYGNCNAVNCTFINNSAGGSGGAIYYSYNGCNIMNCTFVNNSAGANGGAICGGDAVNCTFEGNYANVSGGAMYGGDAVNCTFEGNYALSGGAMYNEYESKAIKCTFIDNKASFGKDVYGNITKQDCKYKYIRIKAENITGYYGNSLVFYVIITNDYVVVPNVNVKISVNGKNYTLKTDNVGWAGIDLNLPVGNYNVTSSYDKVSITSRISVKSTMAVNDVSGEYLKTKVSAIVDDDYLIPNLKIDFKVGNVVYPAKIVDGVATANIDLDAGNYTVTAINTVNNEQKQFNLVINKASSAVSLAAAQSNGVTTLTATLTPATATGNVIFKVNGEDKSAQIKNGKATLTLADLNPGDYAVTASYNGDKNLIASASSAVTFNVAEVYPILTADQVTKTYGTSTKLVVNLADSKGNAIANADVSVVIGSAITHIKTDADGQATMSINKAPGAYTATITYLDAQTTAKINVKKATPKLTAKAKTFKKSLKTKKYTITLKTNTNKVMKNTKVTLKVNGKTYKATTNYKGQATFKITKLTKKGKFTAVVKYAGSKYYNAKTVKPKITVK